MVRVDADPYAGLPPPHCLVTRSRHLGVAAAIVDGVILAGDVTVVDGAVDAVGVRPAGRGGIAVPGFVDLQANGFAGIDFRHCDRAGYVAASAAMGRTGVAAFLATIPTCDRYDEALDAARDAVTTPLPGAVAVGVHLEGPFLSPIRVGAHPVPLLREPDPTLLARWLDAAPVRLVTLAPELPGSGELIDLLVARGVAVAMGHTDADAETARTAIDRGCRGHTHVWNAHRPMSARDPGSAGVVLTSPDAVPCFIADLAHVAGETLAASLAAAADRYVLVTDATAPAGLPDGTYDTPDGRNTVKDGATWIDGRLAGSATPLDQALRNVVALGRPLPEAIAAVTARPAGFIGRPDLGILRPGSRAGVVVLDDELQPGDGVIRPERTG